MQEYYCLGRHRPGAVPVQAIHAGHFVRISPILREVFQFDRVDLCIRKAIPHLTQLAISLGFARVAANGEHPSESGIISVLERRPDSPVRYQYLICTSRERSVSDLITIHEFAHDTDWPDLRSARGMGMQITISDARGEGRHTAQWIAFARHLAKQCKLSGCQFILSSGAESVLELVPGTTLDAILKMCGIDPVSHWYELNRWLDGKLAGRVTI